MGHIVVAVVNVRGTLEGTLVTKVSSNVSMFRGNIVNRGSLSTEGIVLLLQEFNNFRLDNIIIGTAVDINIRTSEVTEVINLTRFSKFLSLLVERIKVK